MRKDMTVLPEIPKQEIDRAKKEVAAYRSTLPFLSQMNFAYSGAVIDANILVNRGWRDVTGCDSSGEHTRDGSAWLEYVHDCGYAEYRIAVSVGQTITAKNESGIGWVCADIDTAMSAHLGTGKRLVFLRRISAMILEKRNLELKPISGKLPGLLSDMVSSALHAAVVERSRLLVDDCYVQGYGFEPAVLNEPCGDSDKAFLQFLTVVESLVSSENFESSARLLMPMARAYLTDNDPDGLVAMRGVKSSELMERLLNAADVSLNRDVVITILGLLLEDGFSVRISDLDTRALSALADTAFCLGMPFCACLVIDYIGNRKATGDGDFTKGVARVFLSLLRYLRLHHDDADVCERIKDAVLALVSACNIDMSGRVLANVLECHVRMLRGEDTAEVKDALFTLARDAADAFDDKSDDGGEVPKWAIGVRAPLAWQAAIFCMLGNSEAVIESFPQPVWERGMISRFRPKTSAVTGLSFAALWYGFLGKEPAQSELERMLYVVSKNVVDVGHSRCYDIQEWVGGPSKYSKMTLMFSAGYAAEELSVLSVVGSDENGGHQATLGYFPHFSKDYPGFEANAVVRVWEYKAWALGEAADAVIRLENGRDVVAVMSWYATDKYYVARGQRMKAKLAGFASSVKKTSYLWECDSTFEVTEGPLVEEAGRPFKIQITEDVFDRFEQGNGLNRISGAFFSLSSKVTDVRKLKAFERDVLCITVNSKTLGMPLDIFISEQHIEGEAIHEGDFVDVFGWMYVDLTEYIDPVDEYQAEHADGAPLLPDDETESTPIYIRTEWSEQERKDIPWASSSPDWMHMALRKVRSCAGVEKAALCRNNPQRINIVARLNGEVRKFAFARIDESAERPFWPLSDVDLILLRTRKSGKGVRLEWELPAILCQADKEKA